MQTSHLHIGRNERMGNVWVGIPTDECPEGDDTIVLRDAILINWYGEVVNNFNRYEVPLTQVTDPNERGDHAATWCDQFEDWAIQEERELEKRLRELNIVTQAMVKVWS